jgi:hypothetical protein
VGADALGNGGPDLWPARVGAVIWIVLHSSAAVLLFGATCATFDHCMGRVSETSVRDGLPTYAKKRPRPFDFDGDDELLGEEGVRPINPLDSQLEPRDALNLRDGYPHMD